MKTCSLICAGLMALRLGAPASAAQPAAASDQPAVRLAILDFETAGATNALAAVGDVCEQVVFEGLARDPRVVLVDRAQLRLLAGEQALSAAAGGDALRLGELLSADWLLLGRVRASPAGVTVEASVLEVVSGDLLMTVGVAAGASAEQTGLRLLERLVAQLPAALEAREKDRTKPAVAILTVQNTSRIRRLDYMLPITGRLLEAATLETGKYRLLRRQQAGVARFETELSFAGWTRPADAVIARHADVVITVELQERYRPGLAFAQTPLELKARLERRHGRTEEVTVVGPVGEKDALLRRFAEQVRTALCGEGGRPVGPGGGAQRVLEAAMLLEKVVGDGSLADESDVPVGAASPAGEVKIGLLEKALYLDPGLVEARFWLGNLLLQSARSSSVPWWDGVAWLERAIRELEGFLQNSRPDGLEHNLGQTREWMSRKPGALHARAQHELIWACYCLWCRATNGPKRPTDRPLTSAERSEWSAKAEVYRRRLIELVTQHVTEPPKKHMPDQIDCLPFVALRASALPASSEAQAEWAELLNRIYGKDHDQYNVRCPFMCLAGELLRAGQPQAALASYERGLTEHQHRLTDWPDNRTLADIHRALGQEAKAREVEAAYQRVWEQKHGGEKGLFEQLVADWQTAHATAAPPMPLVAVRTLGGLPRETAVLAYARHRSGRYFAVGPCCDVGAGAAWSRRQYRYRCQQLFRQAGEGAPLEEFPIGRNGSPARVTVILPLGDFIWFGTQEGLARFEPRTQAWRWFGPKDGLPTACILQGTVAGGKLWCVGGDFLSSMIFSFDPTTEEVRTYLPDVQLGVVDNLAIRDTRAVATSFTHLLGIDLVAGKWAWAPIGAASGPAVVGDEALRQSYDAATPAVECGGRWWVGTTGGLAVMETNAAAFRSVFSSEFPYCRGGRWGVPASPQNCPLSGRVTALAADADLLWVVCDGLAAYAPKQDTWYGPLALPTPIAELVVDGAEIWALGPATMHFTRTDFVQTARAAGLCRTTTEFQRTRSQSGIGP